MAIATANPIISHLRGRLGGIVFRQVQGRLVLSNRGYQSKKESVAQKRNRDKFREASWWAKKQLLDPQKKSFYAAKAKKLKLPNAYTAAISEYMRKSVIGDIKVSRYNGNAVGVISMKISKKDFDVCHAEVTLYDKEGVELESGVATKKDRNRFFYRVTEMFQEKMPVRLCIMAGDPGRITMKELMIDW
jgi:hypothetical protein